MPQSGISEGSDARFDILTPTGLLSLPTLLSFDAKPSPHKVKTNPLTGVPIMQQFPDGWEGSFDVARQDSTLDDYFAMLEAAQYAGANIAAGTIHETITEVNGTLSQYMYTGVQLFFDDAGNYKALSNVIQKVGFWAATKIKVL